MDKKLTGETAEQLAKQPIQYQTAATLLPGTYTLKVLARDDETGRIGTYMRKFIIPNLTRRKPRSDQFGGAEQSAHKHEDALYTATRDRPQPSLLIHEG